MKRHQIRMMLLKQRAYLATLDLNARNPLLPTNKRYFYTVMAEQARENIEDLNKALSTAEI